MSDGVLTKVVRPDREGKVAIPEDVREALGITESTPLTVSVVGDRLIIGKFENDDDRPFREYSDEEIAVFLEEDKVPPELAEWAKTLTDDLDATIEARLAWLLR